jgi:hypothetical protein
MILRYPHEPAAAIASPIGAVTSALEPRHIGNERVPAVGSTRCAPDGRILRKCAGVAHVAQNRRGGMPGIPGGRAGPTRRQPRGPGSGHGQPLAGLLGNPLAIPLAGNEGPCEPEAARQRR